MTAELSGITLQVPAGDELPWLQHLRFARRTLPAHVRSNGGVLVVPSSLDVAIRALAAAAGHATRSDVPTLAPPCSDPAVFEREYSTKEAAAVLGISDRAVRGRCRRGSVRSVLRDGAGGPGYVLDADEVDAIAARSALRPVRAVDVPARPAAEPARSGVDPMTGQRPELMAAVARYGVALGPLSAGDPLPALLKLAVDQGVIRSVQEPIWVSPDGRVGSVAVAGLEVRS